MVSKKVLSRPFPLPTKVIFVGNGLVNAIGGKSCDGALSACLGFSKFDTKFDLSNFGGEFGSKIGSNIGAGFFGCSGCLTTSCTGGNVTVSGWLIITATLSGALGFSGDTRTTGFSGTIGRVGGRW